MPCETKQWIKNRARLAVAGLLAAGFVACAGGETEPAEVPAERIESAGLGLAIEALPANFQLADQSDQALVLEPVGVPGRVELTVGPTATSVNLVDELNAHAEAIRARAEGEYRGQNELMGPLGSMYLSRGRFRDDAGAMVEEYKIIALHPAGDRPIFITYRYPVGDDSKARGEALIELSGEIAPFSAASAGDSAG